MCLQVCHVFLTSMFLPQLLFVCLCLCFYLCPLILMWLNITHTSSMYSLGRGAPADTWKHTEQQIITVKSHLAFSNVSFFIYHALLFCARLIGIKNWCCFALFLASPHVSMRTPVNTAINLGHYFQQMDADQQFQEILMNHIPSGWTWELN